MRITKKILQERLDAAAAFQRCELMVVARNDEHILRGQHGFIPVCCYGHGQTPHENEFGRLRNTRFLTEQLVKWKRPNACLIAPEQTNTETV